MIRLLTGSYACLYQPLPLSSEPLNHARSAAWIWPFQKGWRHLLLSFYNYILLVLLFSHFSLVKYYFNLLYPHELLALALFKRCLDKVDGVLVLRYDDVF